MGTRWDQWTTDEARAALADYAASGESMADFSRRRRISIRRLTYWQKRLARADSPAFVEVTVRASERRQIEIVRDGVIVRVREDLDVGRLVQIVEALAGQHRGC
jgi:hypothetical protein